MAAPGLSFYNLAPACIQHGLPGGLVGSEQIQAPYVKCFEQSGGYFTYGPGTNWDAAGHRIVSASAGLWTITVIGMIVMVLALVAWVWTEHRVLIARAEMLKAAGEPYGIQGPPRMG